MSGNRLGHLGLPRTRRGSSKRDRGVRIAFAHCTVPRFLRNEFNLRKRGTWHCRGPTLLDGLERKHPLSPPIRFPLAARHPLLCVDVHTIRHRWCIRLRSSTTCSAPTIHS